MADSYFKGPDSNRIPCMPAATPFAPRVLIVEDDPETADLLGRYARLLGCDTRSVADGEAARRTASEFLPQIVLLDIGLPDQDGWELARDLRQRLGTNPPVLIAVTAFSSYEDRQRSLEAGIDHHLPKPEFRKELMEVLMRLAGQHKAA